MQKVKQIYLFRVGIRVLKLMFVSQNWFIAW